MTIQFSRCVITNFLKITNCHLVKYIARRFNTLQHTITSRFQFVKCFEKIFLKLFCCFYHYQNFETSTARYSILQCFEFVKCFEKIFFETFYCFCHCQNFATSTARYSILQYSRFVKCFEKIFLKNFYRLNPTKNSNFQQQDTVYYSVLDLSSVLKNFFV